MMTSRALVISVVLGVIVLFTIATCSPKGGRLGPRLLSIDSARKHADSDTSADTLAAIAAQVRETRRLAEQERQLRETTASELTKRIDTLTASLTSERTKVSQQRQQSNTAFERQLSTVVSRLKQLESQPVPTGSLSHEKLPVGAGSARPPSTQPIEDWIWIKPIAVAGGNSRTMVASDVTDARGGVGLLSTPQRQILSSPRRNTSFNLDGRVLSQAAANPDSESRRGYTIPENSTLLDAVSMTGLFGRVPVSGAVMDPLPFRVLTGRENLAAQGYEVPGIEGAVWRGVATGDRALECVQGRLLSVTFVFDDGTISTSRGTDEVPLGTLIDSRGYPCIPGELVSNAKAQIADIAKAGAMLGVAKAFREREVTQSSGWGERSASVTGNAARFVAGTAAEEGLGEVARILSSRLSDTFDAVVVQPGVSVALAIDQPIVIDYQTDGRRIDHVDAVGSHKVRNPNP